MIAFGLFLGDPDGIYFTQKVFNWRILYIFSPLASFWIQTVHQVIMSRQIKKHLLVSPNINRADRFADVMGDKALKAALRSFLDSELSGEIMRFLAAVDKFKASFDKEGRCQRAKDIRDRFVLHYSPEEINIGSNLRDKLVTKIDGLNSDADTPIDIFDGAYNDLTDALLKDGFVRFLNHIAKNPEVLATSLRLGGKARGVKGMSALNSSAAVRDGSSLSAAGVALQSSLHVSMDRVSDGSSMA